MRIRIAGRIGASVALALMASCGGGGGDRRSSTHNLAKQQPIAPRLVLTANIVEQGTHIACYGTVGSYNLVRVEGNATTSLPIACPTEEVETGDHAAAHWQLQEPTPDGGFNIVATVAAVLPPPRVIANGSSMAVLRGSALPLGLDPSLTLVLNARSGAEIGRWTDPTEVMLATPVPTGATWHWEAGDGGSPFFSARAGTIVLLSTDTGVWTAMGIGDVAGNGHDELLGTTLTRQGIVGTGYAASGADALLNDRVFRDVRMVDLNNDGLDDIVANVYGEGCALIGIRRAAGGYDFSTPLRADGSCIGGHGETILVADFDGDGLTDILLPSYERFDFLKNLGNGQFKEMAEEAGILFPNYLPTTEGAAAVDLNLDGNVDIVIGSEVLMNDGTGHFKPQPTPFNMRVTDEGLSVADLDGDGIFDIVKLDPRGGLRIFWGQRDRTEFSAVDGQDPAGLKLTLSFGISVNHFTGGSLPDIMVAGGQPLGTPPHVCVHDAPRTLRCIDNVFPSVPGNQDLILAADLVGGRGTDLAVRSDTTRVYSSITAPLYAFTFELRGAGGVKNMHGHALRASCALDDSLLQLKFVDGGNGYMAQSNYRVPFTSDWCPSVNLSVATTAGIKTIGPFSPGIHRIDVLNGELSIGTVPPSTDDLPPTAPQVPFTHRNVPDFTD